MLILCVIAIIITILLGNTKKIRINMGITGMACAFIIGCFFMKMSVSDVVAVWPTSTMFTMFAVTMFFGFADENGTLPLLAKKMVYTFRKVKFLIPIAMIIIIFIFGAIGVEPVSCTAMFAPFSYALGLAAGFSPLLIVTWLSFGTLVGSNFFNSLGGTIVKSYLANTEFADQAQSYAVKIWLGFVIVVVVNFILGYIFFKGYKAKDVDFEVPEDFNPTQKKNLILIAIFAILILLPPVIQAIAPNAVTKFLSTYCTINLMSILGTFVCLLLKLAEERTVFTKKIPWGAIILVSGVSMLMSVASKAGMVDAVGKWLSGSVSPSIMVPAMMLIAGILSFFSSGLFVVIPMLLPLIPTLAASTGVSAVGLLIALVVGSSITGMSPVSSGGAMCMSANPNEELRAKQFMPQLILVLCYWLVAEILAFIGVFNWL